MPPEQRRRLLSGVSLVFLLLSMACSVTGVLLGNNVVLLGAAGGLVVLSLLGYRNVRRH